jgi:hypothetical protein
MILAAPKMWQPITRSVVPSTTSCGTDCRHLPISIRVSETAHKAIEPQIWDEFAQRCATSFQGTHSYLRAWALRNRLWYRLRLFELYLQGDGPLQKIGQCAIGVGRATSVFVGELQLLTGYSGSWTRATTALLEHLGPGHYRYGSIYSLDKGREEDLKQIGAVTIESVRPLVVEAVDFSRWPTWDDYWRAISSNSRRNARRAEALIPDLSVVIRHGFKAALDVPALLSLRAGMYKRKGLAFEPWRAGLSDLGMIVGCPQYALTAVVSGRNRALAAISAVEFGPHVYHATGGSRPDNGGAAWYLTLSMLRRTYERNPRTAKFIMGYVDYATHDERISGGLLRFRRSCRVSAFPTSVVSFSYGVENAKSSG